MKKDRTINRRGFLRKSAVAASTVALPSVIPSSARGANGTVAPSNRITMGCIGLGGRGTVNMRQFLKRDDVQIVALCDPDEGSTRYEDRWYRGLLPAREAVEQRYGAGTASGSHKGLECYTDFRKVLARDDIDAVTVCTPDHWHALIAIAAAKAGKDIYCEKPLSHNIVEGRAMVEAVRRYGRILQCGSQRRSEAPWRRVCELIRNGRIGKVQTIHIDLMGGHWLRNGSYAPQIPMAVPEGFDYNMWLGPAPWAPYTRGRCHWNFRWNYDYSGGQVTDWGAHLIDMAHWGMGTEHTGPVEVEGRGVFPKDGALWNTAIEFQFQCKYANGMTVIVKSGGGGVRWVGTEGSIQNTGGFEPASLKNEKIGPNELHLYESNSQHGNFIDCVKSRKEPCTPVEVAHRSISVAHLGNIAIRTGRNIQFNPETETITNDAGAAAMLGRAHREPWSI